MEKSFQEKFFTLLFFVSIAFLGTGLVSAVYNIGKSMYGAAYNKGYEDGELKIKDEIVILLSQNEGKTFVNAYLDSDKNLRIFTK